MPPLAKRLDEWVQADLLTAEQASAILAFEEARPGAHWALIGVMALGALVVGIGVISVVAANWQSIPDGVKLLVDFALLVLLAYQIWRLPESASPLWREGLLLVYALLSLASIGLIGQIYHADGPLDQTLLFWCAMVLPPALLTRHPPLPWGWSGILLAALGSLLITSAGIDLFPAEEDRLVMVGLALPLLAALLAVLCGRAALTVHFAAAFRHWAWVSGVGGVLLLDIILSLEPSALSNQPLLLLPGVVLGLLLLIGLLARRDLSMLARALLAGALTLYLLRLPLGQLTGGGELAAALLTLSFLTLTALYLGLQRERKAFQVILLLMGLRFFKVYLVAFGGLLATGLGLIVTGLLILGVVHLWWKHRQQWILWVEKLA